MTDETLQFDRIDPWVGKYQFLPIRDRDGDAYRATLGDAEAIIEPGDGRVRIAYVEAEGDTRMSDLLTAVVDAVDCQELRFVAPRLSGDDTERIWQDRFDAGDPLDDIIEGYVVTEEDWPDDAPEDDDVATVLDVWWDVD
jgi:hypothetical protein